MSYFEQHIRKGLTARPPVASFVVRLRQNLSLKLIALIASILLYFYVQAERNPVAPRAFSATVITQDVPPDMQVQLEKQTIVVSITGPTDIIERLTDRDIHAIVSLKDAARDSTKPQAIHGHFEIAGLDKQTIAKLVFEPTEPVIRFQIFASITRKLSVHPVYPKDAPANYEYGSPILTPSKVEVSGRSDKVNSIYQVVIEAPRNEPGAQINGDFPVMARDKDDNPIEGVILNPTMVHLTVPLVEKLPSKIVAVSPITSGLPVPPYAITKITTIPPRVQIIGLADAIASISTVQTEILPVGDLTETQEIVAHLLQPVTYSIRDMSGHLIDTVRVRIEIQKQPTPAPPKPENTKPPVDGSKPKNAPNSDLHQ